MNFFFILTIFLIIKFIAKKQNIAKVDKKSKNTSPEELYILKIILKMLQIKI